MLYAVYPCPSRVLSQVLSQVPSQVLSQVLIGVLAIRWHSRLRGRQAEQRAVSDAADGARAAADGLQHEIEVDISAAMHAVRTATSPSL